MVDFESFVEVIAANILDALPSYYRDYTVAIQKIAKSGESYTGLVVRNETEKTSSAIPVINLNKLYAKYEAGISEIEELVDEAASIYVSNADAVSQDVLESVIAFNENKIFIRLVNTENSKEYLADKPHFEVEDLSALFVNRISADENGVAEVAVTYELMEEWGLTFEQLKDCGMTNLKNAPYEFIDIGEMLLFPGARFGLYFLSNEHKVKGACEMINPVAIAEIQDRIGEFYILPSSTDEVIILPKEEGVHPEDLGDLVRLVNEEELPLSEQLSGHVYEYIDGELRIVG